MKPGVSQANSASFGDSYNDVQMIEWAGTGVAMSNSRQEAIAVADIVAVNEGWTGVGDTLLDFIKLR